MTLRSTILCLTTSMVVGAILGWWKNPLNDSPEVEPKEAQIMAPSDSGQVLSHVTEIEHTQVTSSSLPPDGAPLADWLRALRHLDSEGCRAMYHSQIARSLWPEELDAELAGAIVLRWAEIDLWGCLKGISTTETLPDDLRSNFVRDAMGQHLARHFIAEEDWKNLLNKVAEIDPRAQFSSAIIREIIAQSSMVSHELFAKIQKHANDLGLEDSEIAPLVATGLGTRPNPFGGLKDLLLQTNQQDRPEVIAHWVEALSPASFKKATFECESFLKSTQWSVLDENTWKGHFSVRLQALFPKEWDARKFQIPADPFLAPDYSEMSVQAARELLETMVDLNSGELPNSLLHRLELQDPDSLANFLIYEGNPFVLSQVSANYLPTEPKVLRAFLERGGTWGNYFGKKLRPFERMPDGWMDWAQTLPNGIEKSAALAASLKAEPSLPVFESAIAALSLSESKTILPEALLAAFWSFPFRGLDEASRLVQTLPTECRMDLVTSLLRNNSLKPDAERAKTLINLVDFTSNSAGAERLIERYMDLQKDAANGLTWATALPDGPLRSLAVESFADRFADSDLVAYSKWLTERPAEDPDRDALIKPLLSKLDDDPEAQFRWTQQLQSRQQRYSHLRRAASDWLIVDPEGAKHALQQFQGSPDEQRLIQRLLQLAE